ncbi:BREX-2 system adenine-specific DNA-methyltransferase PglX [Nocardioides sp. NPDC101246]|uniref:BREX-2 system adenine-specific DNA-methyltransferase PglX n=1 Tax=Nocardioides sp. NPDC101246 TaxID=3364336 RepID=UPI0037F33A54
MINSAALLKDLKGQLKLLQADLRERAEDPVNEWGKRLKEEHAEALRKKRTGHNWVTWRDNEVDQAAVAWIIAATFLRFCEDNDLLAGAHLDGQPAPTGWIAGPGERTARSEENLTAYFRANPTHNRRDWLHQGFRVLAAQPAGEALVDPDHNPVWAALISSERAADLISFWRRTDSSGDLVHDFTDPDLGTRFLGDLYQDLSDHAKKTYALLQTPVFVEEFILDQTLTPALAEFGLDGLKLIDPTCGSGHFLLGAFDRLLERWQIEAPALDTKERVRRAMDSIHGVDLNPFAVAIARFRLTVSALKATGTRSLVALPEPAYHLAIGDSLLGERGVQQPGFQFEGEEPDGAYQYDAEDLADYHGILEPGQYHVVVGNPPYITVKDPALSDLYRKSYATCHRQYALSVPFMELFFRLAVKGEQGRAAGYVAQITANSFMKREFGKKLIENLIGGRNLVLWQENPVDLTAVIDTSGAYIPGHGTPTVILVGRRRRAVGDTVRAVLGVRGEPGQPAEAAAGLVWAEITGHLSEVGFDGRFVSVADLDRAVLSVHPWSLSGGGASAVFDAISTAGAKALREVLGEGVGGSIRAGADEAFIRPRVLPREIGAAEYSRAFVVGESVRDFANSGTERILFPYEENLQSSTKLDAALWPWRTMLAGRATFQGVMADAGLRWTDYMQFTKWAAKATRTITFAEVATHNHFVLERGGKVFKQTAPVIKLPEGASEEDHLALLGVLNSSTACFWLKQVSHNKGEGGGARVDAGYAAMGNEEWRNTYQFGSTKLERFPLTTALPLVHGRALNALAQRLAQAAPARTVAGWLLDPERCAPLGAHLTDAADEWTRVRARMVLEQEELDWKTYHLYGLVDEELTFGEPSAEADAERGFDELNHRGALDLGERAFEIALARRVQAGEEETAWFERHRSTPITKLPDRWGDDYRKVVERRLELIESDPSIRLLEKPEFKRRWATTPWDVQLKTALEAAILDRLEAPELWRDEQGPDLRSVAQLADLLRTDEVLKELVAIYAATAEPDLSRVLGTLIETEAVPFLAAYRYKPSGLEKFRVWQETWELQRREDAGQKVDIAVPPKYGQADFRKPAYWKARGKLDVPKERFIAYPGVTREGDSTPVLGWAGWDHRDQALALGRDIPVQDMLGADDDALTPLVAGLVELEPWLKQWYAEEDPVYGISPAAVVAELIDQYLTRMEMTREQVTEWAPPAATRGRKRS